MLNTQKTNSDGAIRQVGRDNIADAGEAISHLAKDLLPEKDREYFLKIAKEEIAA